MLLTIDQQFYTVNIQLLDGKDALMSRFVVPHPPTFVGLGEPRSCEQRLEHLNRYLPDKWMLFKSEGAQDRHDVGQMVTIARASWQTS